MGYIDLPNWVLWIMFVIIVILGVGVVVKGILLLF